MSRSTDQDRPADPPANGQHTLMAAVMADPLRCKIFMAAAEPTFYVDGEAADDGAAGLSVRQISQRVRESRRRVKYHLDVLREQGLVEVVEERTRQGVIEHYYRSACVPILTKEQIEDLPCKSQQKIILEVLREIFADATAALESGSFVRRPEWTAARLHADVDEQGWRELGVLFETATHDALAVIAEARERLGRTGKKPIRVGASSLLFEAAGRENPL
jgi:DNA-binding transcriptional ArsR family regulator